MLETTIALKASRLKTKNKLNSVVQLVSSPSSGLYSKLGRFNLPSPEAIFDIGYFRKNPVPFFELAKELMPQKLKPTKAHHFLKLMDEKVRID